MSQTNGKRIIELSRSFNIQALRQLWQTRQNVESLTMQMRWLKHCCSARSDFIYNVYLLPSVPPCTFEGLFAEVDEVRNFCPMLRTPCMVFVTMLQFVEMDSLISHKQDPRWFSLCNILLSGLNLWMWPKTTIVILWKTDCAQACSIVPYWHNTQRSMEIEDQTHI